MDAFTLEALAAISCVALLIAARQQAPAIRRTAIPPIPRSIGQLRRRHRRRARAIVSIALECLERHPTGSFEAFTAREALNRYLPETLAAYLDVPPALRRTPRAGRPCADDELSRQLRTLLSGLERVREADAEIGATRMAANGAFLEERFGPPGPPRLQPQALSVFREIADVLGTALRRV